MKRTGILSAFARWTILLMPWKTFILWGTGLLSEVSGVCSVPQNSLCSPRVASSALFGLMLQTYARTCMHMGWAHMYTETHIYKTKKHSASKAQPLLSPSLTSHLFCVYFSQQASHKFGPDCLQQAELLKIKQMFWSRPCTAALWA